MPTSTVTVKQSNGKPYKGARVVLSFSMSGLPPSGGVTLTSTTDSSGEAVIEHSKRGSADIIVNGNTLGSMSAPGSATVHV